MIKTYLLDFIDPTKTMTRKLTTMNNAYSEESFPLIQNAAYDDPAIFCDIATVPFCDKPR